MADNLRRHTLTTEVHLRVSIHVDEEEVAGLLDGEDRGSAESNIQEALDRLLDTTLTHLSITESKGGVQGTRLKILSVDSAPSGCHFSVETTVAPEPCDTSVMVVACPSCCTKVTFNDDNISTENYGWDRIQGNDASAQFIDCPVCDDSIPLYPGEENGHGVQMWEWVEASTPGQALYEYKACKTKGEERDVGI